MLFSFKVNLHASIGLTPYYVIPREGKNSIPFKEVVVDDLTKKIYLPVFVYLYNFTALTVISIPVECNLSQDGDDPADCLPAVRWPQL